MSFPKEQIINAIVIGLCAIFLAKLFAPVVFSLFNDLFSKNKPKKGGANLEAMIAHKEAMLRKGENSKNSSLVNNDALEAGIKNKRAGKSEVEIRYLDYSDELNKVGNEELLEDVQKTLALFESLQWGEGQAISEVRTKFNKKFSAAPTQRTFINNLKNLLKREVPLSRSTKNLPQYNEITDLLITKTFLQGFCGEDDFSKELAKAVSRKLRISMASILKAVAAFLAKVEGQNEQKIYKTIVEAKNPFSAWDLPSREKLVNKALITEDKKYFVSIKDLIESITAEAHLFHTLSPLPPLNGKNDIPGALKIFGLTEEASAEEIKKTYKKLSMLKHPDRLASKGIPKSFEEVANDNFTQIQAAYDILKNKD
ncbi:MAG: hypothetical protein CME70_13355 [Halobacteriovorax sp.]|nr:hypothetical protein [Halobacteriovorax sp.]|tara:strand:+ start:55220 stop:56326 length:1107 start_codon:yes stop_codon:yes gene_type:complete